MRPQIKLRTLRKSGGDLGLRSAALKKKLPMTMIDSIKEPMQRADVYTAGHPAGLNVIINVLGSEDHHTAPVNVTIFGY